MLLKTFLYSLYCIPFHDHSTLVLRPATKPMVGGGDEGAGGGEGVGAEGEVGTMKIVQMTVP